MASEMVYPFPLPENVGSNFAEQYYNILHYFPEEAYKFYKDSSVLSRPGPDGKMTTVTAMQGINDMILSLDYKNRDFEISTIDTQRSFNGGVVIMVTGYLTGKDNLKRMFSQVFFLAPQETGLFVLNDIFNYFDQCADGSVDAGNVVESAPESPKTPDLVETNDGFKSDHSPENENPPLVEDAEGGHNTGHLLENRKKSTDEIGLVREDPVVVKTEEIPAATETAAPTILEDAPKKSFATLVNALNDNATPFQRVSPAKPAGKPQIPSAPKLSSQKIGAVVNKTNMPAVNAHAIFVPNLPMGATVEELEKLFMKFGSIKPNGIQVRSKQYQGSCFGFVEFESATSMQNALKASPILFGNRKLFIEERRAVSKDGGRHSSGHGGYRNNNYRPRGNFSEEQGNGRRNGREFVGQSQGNIVQNGEATTPRFQ